MAQQPHVQRVDTLGALYLPNLIAALLAGVGLIIGSIGPWITFFAMTRGGMDADGLFTLILGVISVAGLFAVLNLGRIGGRPGWMSGLSGVAAVAGALGLLIAVMDIIDIKSRSAEFFGTTMRPEIGWGLWLVLISSLALSVTAIIVLFQARKVLPC